MNTFTSLQVASYVMKDKSEPETEILKVLSCNNCAVVTWQPCDHSVSFIGLYNIVCYYVYKCVTYIFLGHMTRRSQNSPQTRSFGNVSSAITMSNRGNLKLPSWARGRGFENRSVCLFIRTPPAPFFLDAPFALSSFSVSCLCKTTQGVTHVPIVMLLILSVQLCTVWSNNAVVCINRLLLHVVRCVAMRWKALAAC